MTYSQRAVRVCRLAVVRGCETRTAAEVTRIQFGRLTEDDIAASSRRAPMDKAGA